MQEIFRSGIIITEVVRFCYLDLVAYACCGFFFQVPQVAEE